MTVEPASTRANWINSDSLDWSYIGISFTVGHSTSARCATGRSTAHAPSTPNRWPQTAGATHCCNYHALRLGVHTCRAPLVLDLYMIRNLKRPLAGVDPQRAVVIGGSQAAPKLLRLIEKLEVFMAEILRFPTRKGRAKPRLPPQPQRSTKHALPETGNTEPLCK